MRYVSWGSGGGGGGGIQFNSRNRAVGRWPLLTVTVCCSFQFLLQRQNKDNTAYAEAIAVWKILFGMCRSNERDSHL
jgi:hypothetical protein